MLNKIKEKAVEYFYEVLFVFRLLFSFLFMLFVMVICYSVGYYFLRDIGGFVGVFLSITIFAPITFMMLPK